MKNIETRKTIALAMSAAYIVLTAFGMMTGKEVPVQFVAIAGGVIGYYFGKSTALETPKV